MDFRFPEPLNWQDFERLCLVLWKDIWNDPNAQRNGRAGQPQAGVDVYGKPLYHGSWAGVQCKDKDGRLGSRLTAAQFHQECMAAQRFSPALSDFSVATTAPRDASLQLLARRASFAKRYPFRVSVWSWDDISEELRFRPHLIPGSYPMPPSWLNGEAKIKTSSIGHADQLASFLRTVDMDEVVPHEIQAELASVLLELADNAYLHGRATQFSVTLRAGEVWAEDNGQPFNPLIELDATRASVQSHIGSLVFKRFLEGNQGAVSASYEVVQALAGPLNRLILRFHGSNAWRALDKPEARLTIEGRIGLGGRQMGERYADSIKLTPETTRVIVNLSHTWVVTTSGLFGFLCRLLPRLGPTTRLTFIVPLNQCDTLSEIATDERIEWIRV